MEQRPGADLLVQGTPIQTLYGQYLANRFVVNRRYQRKLVWTSDEKSELIDSIARRMPIPLLLLAEPPEAGGVEIIDGLQRLNAIFSFIENAFPISFEGEAGYFDLATLADTKALSDQGVLVQGTPILSRDVCRGIVNYQLPISTFKDADERQIDEIFRRINSAGRQLGVQEIRQAGSTSSLAGAVRELSSTVRGDVSMGSLIPLAKMAVLAISDEGGTSGIDLDELFWTKNSILEREGIRESVDEELVLDLVLDVAYMPQLKSSGQSYRDSAYGLRDTAPSSSTQITEAAVLGKIATVGSDEVRDRFLRVLAELDEAISVSGQGFAPLVSRSDRRANRAFRRHFHMVFTAICELIFLESKEVVSPKRLAEALDGLFGRVTVPKGGGNFAGDTKRKVVDLVKAALAPAFVDSLDPRAEADRAATTRIKGILDLARTEEELIDVKMGFLDQDSLEFNSGMLEKILKTLSAMSNTQRVGSSGLILVGVVDPSVDGRSVLPEERASIVEYRNWEICGVQHELEIMQSDEDTAWNQLVNRASTASTLPSAYRDEVAERIRPVRFGGTHLLWMFEAPVVSSPVPYGEKFFVRRPSSNRELTGEALVRFVSQFSIASES